MVARPSPLVMRFFDHYVVRLLRRRFDRVRLWGRPEEVPVPRERPLIFAVSHASWWDVLVGYHLARAVVRVESVGPMDQAQLARYPVLRRLGVYGVDRGSAAGVRAFLRDTTALLRAGRAVWMTPQGEIASAWRRPVRFQPGIGHLVRRVAGVAVVPVAVVYEFREEARPEIFVKLGAAETFDGDGRDIGTIVARLERALEGELDAVQSALTRGDLSPFSVLLEGATSVSVVYDALRRARRLITGRPDPARHGALVSDPRRRPT